MNFARDSTVAHILCIQLMQSICALGKLQEIALALNTSVPCKARIAESLRIIVPWSGASELYLSRTISVFEDRPQPNSANIMYASLLIFTRGVIRQIRLVPDVPMVADAIVDFGAIPRIHLNVWKSAISTRFTHVLVKFHRLDPETVYTAAFLRASFFGNMILAAWPRLWIRVIVTSAIYGLVGGCAGPSSHSRCLWGRISGSGEMQKTN